MTKTGKSTAPDGVPEFLLSHFNDIAKSEGLSTDYRIEYEAGAKPGDGFMSDLLAVTLVGPPRPSEQQPAAEPLKPVDGPAEIRVALVCKMQLKSSSRNESSKNATLFDREVFVYNRLFPLFNRLQRTLQINESNGGFFSFPKCYVAQWDVFGDDSFIIMQDLRAQGYEMLPKRQPTEFEHAKLVLQQLGRMHGLSFVLRDQRPEVYEEYMSVPNNYVSLIKTESAHTMFDSAFRRAARLLDSPADQKLMEKLRTQWEPLMLEVVDAKKLGNVGVFGHSDCYNNNLMFKSENGKPTNVCLLDWQFARPMSPVDDLVMYLCSSTEKPLRDQHYDEFLHIYYDSLAAIVRQCGSDPDKLYTYEDFVGSLSHFGHYGVIEAALTISILVADNEVPEEERVPVPAEETSHYTHFSEHTEQIYKQRLSDVLADARKYKWFSFEDDA